MGLGETFVLQASLGLELVDELTADSLVGASHVTVFRATVPDQELQPTSFLVGRSRWVFENLGDAEEIRIDVDSDFYFSEVIETGQTAFTLADPGGVPIPSLLTDATRFVTLRLRPRTGYPFPSALTRIVGSVLLKGSPVPDADVQVTARYRIAAGSDNSAPAPGEPPFETRTGDDGQFVAWLFPNVDQDFPAAIAFDATATVPGHTGTVLDQPVVPQTVNGVTIPLAP
jgi:hypothetical protein